MPNAENHIGLEQAGIGSVLKNNLLHVPENQREYAWTEREIEQLLTDFARTIDDNDDYFLGTIVTIPREDGHLEVVDGQQRLATSAILLSAIRLYMKDLGEEMIEQSIHNDFLTGIDRAQRQRIPKLTLNTSDNHLFRQIVTCDNADELPEPSLESHRLLLSAFGQVREYVKHVVQPYDRRDHGDRLNEWVTFLESKSLVVLLRVGDDADAYRMFETLNDRGLRTSQADLIKNFLFGRAGGRIREVQDRWLMMRGTLETLAEDDITVTFLRHALIARHGYLRESDVYRSVSDSVKSANLAVKFAADIEALSTTYVALYNPENEVWNGKPSAVRKSIEALNILDIRPIVPIQLAVASRFTKAGELAQALQFLLSLGVRLMVASSTRSSGVELPLARAAHSVWEGSISSAKKLRQALKSITPSDEEFRNRFEDVRVASSKLARYYLRSLERTAMGEEEPWFVPIDDNTVINLEHILPKKPDDNWPQFRADEVRIYGNRLGNLALMRASDNSSLKNDAFGSKRDVFGESPYVLTSRIGAYAAWTADEIVERQKLLASLAAATWPID